MGTDGSRKGMNLRFWLSDFETTDWTKGMGWIRGKEDLSTDYVDDNNQYVKKGFAVWTFNPTEGAWPMTWGSPKGHGFPNRHLYANATLESGDPHRNRMLLGALLFTTRSAV